MSDEQEQIERIEELIEIVNREIAKNREAVAQYEQGTSSTIASARINDAVGHVP
jgi:hypothetical protein